MSDVLEKKAKTIHKAELSNPKPWTPERARAFMMDEIILMSPDDLSLMRENCVANRYTGLKTKMEQKNGVRSAPEADQYCVAVLKRAVVDDRVGGLYNNLALQQLGIGRQVTFESDYDRIGDAPVKLVRSIRAAAEAGQTTYEGAKGTPKELTCALALDAGVTWGAANPTKVDRPGFTEEQVGKMAKACYNPDITSVTIGATGEVVPIAKIGLIAGELLGQKFKTQVDTASSGPVAPQPLPAPERAVKPVRTRTGG